MYMHPDLVHRVVVLDMAQRDRDVERVRFVREHRGQIVARPAGGLRRMLRALRRPQRPAVECTEPRIASAHG